MRARIRVRLRVRVGVRVRVRVRARIRVRVRVRVKVRTCSLLRLSWKALSRNSRPVAKPHVFVRCGSRCGALLLSRSCTAVMTALSLVPGFITSMAAC